MATDAFGEPCGDTFDVDAFCLNNSLDEQATAQLKELDEGMQREVLGRGPLTDARNPSAVLLSRIRQLKQGGGRRKGGGGGGGGFGGHKDRDGLDRDVEAFIRDNDLDHRASACLRESDDDILGELFARGPLTGARNPSAMVLSRIRTIKEDLASGRAGKSRRGDGGRGDKGKGKGKGDDWWSWYMPPWAGGYWGGKGEWDSWGKGAWDWGKGKGGDGKGKGGWDEGKGANGKGEDGGKGRAAPY